MSVATETNLKPSVGKLHKDNILLPNKVYFQHDYFKTSSSPAVIRRSATSSYPKVQVKLHVLEKAPNHGSQVNDVGWPMFFKHRPCLLKAPEQRPQSEESATTVSELFCMLEEVYSHMRLASLEERNIHSSPSLAPPSSLTTCCMALPTNPDPPVTNTLAGTVGSP